MTEGARHGGEKASGTFLIEQATLVAKNVRDEVVAGSGHWLMGVAPKTAIPMIVELRVQDVSFGLRSLVDAVEAASANRATGGTR